MTIGCGSWSHGEERGRAWNSSWWTEFADEGGTLAELASPDILQESIGKVVPIIRNTVNSHIQENVEVGWRHWVRIDNNFLLCCQCSCLMMWQLGLWFLSGGQSTNPLMVTRSTLRKAFNWGSSYFKSNWLVGPLRQLAVQAACSVASCRVPNSDLGGVLEDHGEGLLASLEEILANHETPQER